MMESQRAIPVNVPNMPAAKPFDPKQVQAHIKRLKELLAQHNAVVIAHYYTDPELQMLAEQTDGFIGDSLAMAAYGYQHSANTLVVVGVRFMGETAKILSPHKTVIMPTLEAECSLDLGCLPEAFQDFCNAHPDRTVVVYANTSAAVKAQADWVVTSSNALAIVDHLDSLGQKILWAPDRHLGHYIQQQTNADLITWAGACVVHEEFRVQGVLDLQKDHPQAKLLVHPESPAELVAMADVVGSTTRLLKASQELAGNTFIVATDRGIFYKMQQAAPHKTFLQAPTRGAGADCRSCGHCPWMAMNSLERLEQALIKQDQTIQLSASIIEQAQIPLKRMLEFAKQ